MSLDYIRKTYGVPATVGGRVNWCGGRHPVPGTITGSKGAYLMICLDRQPHAMPYHPDWFIEYLEPAADEHPQRELSS